MFRSPLLAVVLGLLVADGVRAQGPWVPAPGQGSVYSGVSRKTASAIFDINGEHFDVPSTSPVQNHDFRYVYLTGEVGLIRRLSGTFVLTYLYGLEGPEGHLEKNVGPSDAWFGLKYNVLEGGVPVSAALTVRTPFLYDMAGPYTRRLFDADSNFVGPSPEWRGLLKHDLTAQLLVGRSLRGGEGWAAGGLGYTWREGAPADAVPVHAEVGHRVPVDLLLLRAKASGVLVRSLGNYSDREPEDRFGFNPNGNQNLNDQSYGRVGLALLAAFGPSRQVDVEVGYNRVVWGRSARKYDEPYVSLGVRF